MDANATLVTHISSHFGASPTSVDRQHASNPQLAILLATTLPVLLISLLFAAASGQELYAQNRRVDPAAINGFPPVELLVSDLPLYSDVCCGRLDVRAQFLVKNSTLFWADSSETPIKRMPTNGGEITPMVRWAGSPLKAVVRGQYIYWIEQRYNPNTAQPLPRLNRTSLDGMSTTILDEAQRTHIDPGTTDILVTDSDAYWVSSVDVNFCNEGSCTTGREGSIRRVSLNGGSPTTLVTTSLHSVILSLATDGTYLYWEESGVYIGSSRVKRIPLGGGQVSDLVDGSLNGVVEHWGPAGGIAVHGADLFFASFGEGFMKVPVSGGAVSVLSRTKWTYETAPRKLAVDDTALYWFSTTAIYSMPHNGGNITTLASGVGLPTDLVISDGRAIWAEDYCCGGGLFTGSIKMVPTTGGAPVTLLGELDGVRSVDVASGTLYFIQGSYYGTSYDASGRIAKAPIDGGAVTTLVTAVMADAGTPMAIDDSNVYFADATGLKKASLQGGVVERLASEVVTDTVSALATDGQFVYWLSRRVNPIVRKISVGGGPIEDIVPSRNALRYATGRLVLENGYLYWIERSYSAPAADAIMKVSVTGGPVITLASNMPPLGDVAVAGANLYFTEADNAILVRKISIDGGPISTVSGVGYAILAANNEAVYWVDLFNLGTAPTNGGAPRWLAGNTGGVGLAVDAAGIYWLHFEGNILKIDRSTIDGFVNMVAPRLGEAWTIRSRKLIQWWYAGVGGRVTISLSRDGGSSWSTLFRNKPNTGSVFWKVTKPATTQAIIRVCSVSTPTLCDTSDTFTIQ